MIICSIIDEIFKFKFKNKLSGQGLTSNLFHTIYFMALLLKMFGQSMTLRGQMRLLGTVTPPKSNLLSAKLLAAFQMEFSSTHSSTSLRSLLWRPASANIFSSPPLLIVARWKCILGVAITPPDEICLSMRFNTSVLLSDAPKL